jgi:hypothetical protein
MIKLKINKIWVMLLFVYVFFTIALVSSTATFYNNSIQKSYSGGDILSGKIEVKLSNESSQTRITSNFPGEISLIDLLIKSEFSNGNGYNCSTNNCLSSYRIQGNTPINSIDFTNETIIAFKIRSSSRVEVTHVNISFKNDVSSSCDPPLRVDFLGEINNSIYSPSYVDESCYPNNFGCYNDLLDSTEYTKVLVSNSGLCQKINLQKAPSFRIGGKIINSTNGKSGNMIMELRDLEGANLASCTINSSFSQSIEQKDCIINYSIKEENDYLVCIRKSTASTADYTIRSEYSDENCGSANNGGSYDQDFSLYARPLKYGKSDFTVSDNYFLTLYGEKLTDKINNYLYEVYGGICNKPYCVVPIKLSGVSQTLDINQLDVRYDVAGASAIGDGFIYEALEDDAKISSDIINLDLSKSNITIPLMSSEQILKIYFDGIQKISIPINVTKGFSIDMYPKSFNVGVNTQVYLISNQNLSSVVWNFGDGSSQVNEVNKFTNHKYTQEGNYTIRVSATRKDGVVRSGEFKVYAGNLNESAAKLINEYEKRISNLTSQLSSYSTFSSSMIKKAIDLDNISKNVSSIKSAYIKFENDSELSEIVSELMNIDLPTKIVESEVGAIQLLALANSWDPNEIIGISNMTYSDIKLDNVKRDISVWNFENYKSEISYSVISGIYDSGSKDLLMNVKIKLNPITQNSYKQYFIISLPRESISFSSNYNLAQTDSGSVYFELPSTPTIEFSTSSTFDINQVMMYISPEINNLGGDYGVITPVEVEKFKTGRFWLLISILFLLTLIVYVILQEWYKRNYERYLFKSRDDVYNLINFIYNSRFSDHSDADIKRRLLDAKWSHEQISYGFKKIDGRRTGMYEIPLFKWRENKIVAQEIAKRQGGPVDARFIKQPKSY